MRGAYVSESSRRCGDEEWRRRHPCRLPLGIHVQQALRWVCRDCQTQIPVPFSEHQAVLDESIEHAHNSVGRQVTDSTTDHCGARGLFARKVYGTFIALEFEYGERRTAIV